MIVCNLKPNERRRNAFTLIEVMVALTLTLLMMLSLARAFKVIGLRIGESQSELTMNADLREISTRLRQELDADQLTADPSQAPTNVDGYFTYYEGPMTNETTTHVSLARPFDADNPDYVERSRYGDLDDYLAFTATAPPSRGRTKSQFMGFIPRGVLAAHQFYAGREIALDPAYIVPGYTAASSVELVPFYSDEAEIIYWLSPRWAKNDDGTVQYHDPNNNGAVDTGEQWHPLYRDSDGDQLPDTMNLHRRVLLIRPDLNLSMAQIVAANGTGTTSLGTRSVLPFLEVTTTGGTTTQRIVPISSSAFNGSDTAGNVNFFDTSASYPDAPGNWHTGQNTATPNWLTGMAALHQVMDLSVSRRTNDWVSPNNWNAGNYNPAQPPPVIPPPPALPPTPPHPSPVPTELIPTNENSRYGMPSRLVAANSLTSLTRPENRFAHVRMPDALLGDPPLVTDSTMQVSSNVLSTMPLLALCPPHPFMVAAEQLENTAGPIEFNDTTFVPDVPANQSSQPGIVRDLPSQADPDGESGSATVGDSTINPLLRYGRFTMVGFLRPEFALQDRIPNGTANPTRIDRGRSDVVATNLLAFDIKAFDPSAPSYVFLGADGEPGNAGDDDGDGETTDADELGLPGSDDELVLLDDLNIRRAIDFPNNFVLTTTQGAFVDLNYGHLAGHPLGDVLTKTPLSVAGRGLSASRFSGVEENLGTSIFSGFMQQSGRFIIRRNGGLQSVNSFFQPSFDTFTTDYLDDGFDQEGKIHADAIDTDSMSINGDPQDDAVIDFGMRNQLITLQRDAGDGSGTNVVFNKTVGIRRWSNFATTSPGAIGANLNIDTASNSTAGLGPSQQSQPYDVCSPTGNHEPQGRMRAIQITIRLYDQAADRIRQQTIVQKF